MEWINDLQGKTVGLDTAPLIYFIEENPAYIEMVRLFFEAMDKGDFLVITSTVTLLEVLVHPLRYNNRELATEYRDILLNSRLMTLEVSNAIAEQATGLRAVYNIRTPDAKSCKVKQFLAGRVYAIVMNFSFFLMFLYQVHPFLCQLTFYS